MNYKDFINFFNDSLHIMDMNTQESRATISSSVRIQGTEFSLHQNMLTNQLFSVVHDYDKKPKLYICVKYPNKWISMKDEETSKFINLIKIQQLQLKKQHHFVNL